LGNLEGLDKAAVGRKLAQTNGEIRALSTGLDKMVAVSLMLCLEDSAESCQTDYLRQYQQNQLSGNLDVAKDVYVLTNLYYARFYQQVDNSISYVLTNGLLVQSKPAALPELIFGMYSNQDLNGYLQELISQGRIPGFDAKRNFLYHSVLSHDRFNGGLVIIVRDASPKQQEVMKKILKLRELFDKKSLFEDLLRLPDGFRAEWDENGRLKRVVPPKSDSDEDEEFDSTSRFLETDAHVVDWNSDLREAGIETLKAPFRKGKDNLAHLEKENEEHLRAYKMLEGYSKTFEKSFGVDYDSFFRVVTTLMRLCYDRPHTAGVWDTFELSRKMKAKTGIRPKVVRKIIELLSASPELMGKHCAAIVVGNKILVNYHRLMIARLVLSESCFDEAYDLNLKGGNFEEACRKLMRGKGLTTLPDGVQIHEPMLPEQISYKLWNRLKASSQIDVVSCHDNRVIILECKEIKPARKPTRKFKRLEKLILKKFETYSAELFYKTEWVAKNLSKFERYLGGSLSSTLSIDKSKAVIFFPLIVTNRLIEIEEEAVPIITYIELKEMDFPRDLQKVDLENPNNSVEMQALGRTISVPRFATVE